MYIILSFDFGGSYDVVLHCMSVDGLKAQRIYNILVDKYKNYNHTFENQGVKRLIEFLKVPDDFEWEEGMTFFWGSTYFPGVERISCSY